MNHLLFPSWAHNLGRPFSKACLLPVLPFPFYYLGLAPDPSSEECGRKNQGFGIGEAWAETATVPYKLGDLRKVGFCCWAWVSSINEAKCAQLAGGWENQMSKCAPSVCPVLAPSLGRPRLETCGSSLWGNVLSPVNWVGHASGSCHATSYWMSEERGQRRRWISIMGSQKCKTDPFLFFLSSSPEASTFALQGLRKITPPLWALVSLALRGERRILAGWWWGSRWHTCTAVDAQPVLNMSSLIYFWAVERECQKDLENHRIRVISWRKSQKSGLMSLGAESWAMLPLVSIIYAY